ncbi:MAG: hypothetical protein JSS57_14885 [Proteobacteria bacterium]|nr:hypothetical protein [Pseudomonadota bacterium]
MTARVYMRHVRKLRGRGVTCTPGIRAWCAAHGVDMRKLANEGIPVSDAHRIGGAFMDELIEIVRKEAQDDGR